MNYTHKFSEIVYKFFAFCSTIRRVLKLFASTMLARFGKLFSKASQLKLYLHSRIAANLFGQL